MTCSEDKTTAIMQFQKHVNWKIIRLCMCVLGACNKAMDIWAFLITVKLLMSKRKDFVD